MKVLSIVVIFVGLFVLVFSQGGSQAGSGYHGRRRQGQGHRRGHVQILYRHGPGYQGHGSRYQHGPGYQGSVYRHGPGYQGSVYRHGPGYQHGTRYQHGSGYGYKKVICPKLANPANGAVKLSGNRPGSVASYSCNSGFVLVGISTRKCLNDGTWSGKAPICRRINCGSLPNIANGAVAIAPDTRFGSMATYSCKSGFELDGNEKRTCQANGQWSGSEPSCVEIDCGPLANIANGELRLTGTKFRDTATYICNNGFILIGDRQRRCRSVGQWSGAEPTCRKVDCGPLSNIENGWVHVSETTFQSMAFYRCKLGFVLNGAEKRTCEADGDWNPDAPTCEPIDCGPQPEADTNGRVVSTEGTSLGDETVYACNAGFTPQGSTTVYCQNDGTYSDTAPSCIPVDCNEPDPSDPNGSVEFTTTTFRSEARYSCNSGFTLIGTPVAVCQANGQWSSEAPDCKPVDCGNLDAPENGNVAFYPGTTFTSTATFSCNRGFRLVGSRVRTCQADGNWSGVQPVCKKIRCPKLKAPQYGKIYTSGYYPGDYAVYDCIYGYNLVGPRRRTCRHNGNWSGTDPDCKKDNSYYPSHPKHYGSK